MQFKTNTSVIGKKADVKKQAQPQAEIVTDCIIKGK
jgi:hypothetical protein